MLRLLSLSPDFCVSADAPGSILKGSVRVWGEFWSLPAPIFRCLVAHHTDIARKTSILEKPLKTSTGAIKFKVRAVTPCATIDQKSSLERLAHAPASRTVIKLIHLRLRASRDSLLEGFGCLLGASWAPLGRSWAPSWQLLGASWPSLERSWVPSGCSWVCLGCILAPRDAPGLDFGGFGGVSGWILESFGGMFWHAFRCASHS